MSLEAFNSSQELPQIFSAGNWKDILRATTIGEEFGIDYIVLGGETAIKELMQLQKQVRQ